jgi:hypothetical protein
VEVESLSLMLSVVRSPGPWAWAPLGLESKIQEDIVLGIHVVVVRSALALDLGNVLLVCIAQPGKNTDLWRGL